ncbi:hypothetical protein AB9E15_33455, partial [Rhizobium leguminosarum]|uniref:hypothetical protein n=1 Tax=Rhizobium leguminosarum TaxID=384 RepID=UPI003F961083
GGRRAVYRANSGYQLWEDRIFDCRALTDDISTESAFPLFAIAQVNSYDRRASVLSLCQVSPTGGPELRQL